ncbi:MAG TPA: hypothetical protein VFV34_09900 [Blastocatellia bacterium]|nr:hypothetical protein [Blastocatellia bacterium]
MCISTTTLLSSLLISSITYFVLNSILMAVVFALKTGKSLLTMWWNDYSWITLAYAAG